MKGLNFYSTGNYLIRKVKIEFKVQFLQNHAPIINYLLLSKMLFNLREIMKVEVVGMRMNRPVMKCGSNS